MSRLGLCSQEALTEIKNALMPYQPYIFTLPELCDTHSGATPLVMLIACSVVLKSLALLCFPIPVSLNLQSSSWNLTICCYFLKDRKDEGSAATGKDNSHLTQTSSPYLSLWEVSSEISFADSAQRWKQMVISPTRKARWLTKSGWNRSLK